MTQSPGDRIDQIESALDRQIQVNAELRTSTEILKASVGELATSTDTILNIVNQHQDNFMVLVAEIRDIRTDIRRILDRLGRSYEYI
jgi:septal ring factor EnvC (AmiA/AmiB activator)